MLIKLNENFIIWNKSKYDLFKKCFCRHIVNKHSAQSIRLWNLQKEFVQIKIYKKKLEADKINQLQMSVYFSLFRAVISVKKKKNP